jgi:molecular chaperone DnaJ
MDLYELLGLARGATLIEIKRSYRRLARKYHPDINPGDNAAEARFREITRAYETLADPELRGRYDAAGAMADGSDTITFEFEGFDFSGEQGHAPPSFGDLFADLFTQRQESRASHQPAAGADPPRVDSADVRRVDDGDAAAVDAYAPRNVSLVQGRRSASRARIAVPALPG